MLRRRVVGLMSVFAALVVPASASAAEWTVLGASPATGQGVFRFPQALAYTPGGGRVFVGDQLSAVVQRFSRDGVWQADIGYHADDRERGRIGVLGGLATDREGHLLVLDSENDRVQVFDAESGRWLAAWGTRGTKPGRFQLGRNTGAGGVAIDQPAAGSPATVYIADQNNHRVQAFPLTERTSSGDRVLPPGAQDPDRADVVPVPQPARTWGRFGSCTATGCASPADRDVLDHPQGVAVDPRTRNVLVADDRNHRVVEYRPDGSFVRQVGSFGTGNGQFRFPYDVGVDAREPRQVYVADNNNHRVQVFDAGSLAFVRGWGAFGPEPGELEYPRALGAVADDPAGGVAVADTANNRVQVFGADGRLSAQWGIPGRGPGYVTRPGGVAVDAAGTVHVADTLASRVQRLGADGAYQGQSGYISTRSGFASPAAGDGQFDEPQGIAIDATRGRVWVADTNNGRIQELGLDGSFIASHTGLGFRMPRAVVVGPDGAVIVADTGGDRVQRRDPATGAWSEVSIDVSMQAPSGVAVHADNSILVGDTGGNRVLRVAGGRARVLPGAYNAPRGLAVRGDSLYVADTGSSRVLRDDLVSGARTVLGREGSGLGAFVAPTGVALDPSGSVLVVADTGNDRIQRLQLAGSPPATTQRLGVAVSGPGIVTSQPAGIACANNCRQSFTSGSAVTLVPTPDAGATFTGWGGACSGTGGCTVTMTAAATLTAGFAAAPPPPPPPPPPPAPANPVPAARLNPPVAVKPDRTPPRLSSVRLSPTRLRPARRGAPVARKRVRGGALLRLRLSEAARVTFGIDRRESVVRSALPRGTSRLWVTGRLRGRVLRRGTHRLTLRATDAAGNASRMTRLRFRVR